MGQTQVDLYHLLEDLRDAYPGSPEETVLTEIVANCLDSGAHLIGLVTDPSSAAFTVIDDGSGMQRRALARYHNIASSSKTPGVGIGFAGVGIKLGLLLSDEVYTETRRGKIHIATRWHLGSRHRAPWKWVPPSGCVAERGTAVRLRLTNVLSPLLDPGFIEVSLRRHFEPLFDPTFDALFAAHYEHPIRFLLNGTMLDRRAPKGDEVAPIAVKLARRRKPSAVGYLIRSASPLPEEGRGVAISTFGKVIKRGWDWLGVSPTASANICGLIEVPELAGCLTLNKADFIRSGSRGLTYLAYRKAIQELVSRHLAAWGDSGEPAEEAKRRAARPVERDLERVLADLAGEFPLLTALVEHRAGGQRRLPMGGVMGDTRARALTPALAAASMVSTDGGPGAGIAMAAEPSQESVEGQADSLERPEDHTPADPVGGPDARTLLPGAKGPRRPQRYGLSIQFQARPDDEELGRLVDSSIWVNESHPAYRRAVESRSAGYHLALTVAMALAPLAAEPSQEHAFVSAFLARWGEAVAPNRKGVRRGSR